MYYLVIQITCGAVMVKVRVSLTLEEDVLKRLDFYSSSSGIDNRSFAVEEILKSALASKSPRKAVILCGGEGTRLRPLTYEIPKSMVPVQGKPVLEHLINLFRKHGIFEIILCVGYLKDKIKSHFGDGSKYGVKITYVEENEPLGTAGPIKLCKDLINETFIVSNGDERKNVNIPEMVSKCHRINDALGTIALTTVQDTSTYGVAKLDGSKILEFVEKPSKGKAPSNLINSGLYVLEPEVIDMIPKGFSMLEKDIFPKLAKKGRLYGYPFSGQWFTVGTIDQYEVAIKNW